MARVGNVIRRSLQLVLVLMTLSALWMHSADRTGSRTGLTVAALFATLFVLSVAGEAYSRWWARRHVGLSPEQLAALRNRTALYVLCAALFGVLLLIFVSARGIPLQFIPILAGVIAIFQFARTVGKK